MVLLSSFSSHPDPLICMASVLQIIVVVFVLDSIDACTSGSSVQIIVVVFWIQLMPVHPVVMYKSLQQKQLAAAAATTGRCS